MCAEYTMKYDELVEVQTKVVHCKREKYDVYIGRPSAWGNPFSMNSESERDAVVEKYKKWLMAQPRLIERAQRELRGQVLGCWCAPRRCHGDVLIAVANVNKCGKCDYSNDISATYCWNCGEEFEDK